MLVMSVYGTDFQLLQGSKIRHYAGIADMPPARQGLGYAGL
jgi:hypothetical protein